MLVVVYTSDGYWIGADSTRNRDGKRVETVCKVHDTKFGLLLKAGNSQGTTAEGVVYSTDKELEDLLAASTSAEEFKADLRSKFKSDIEAELVFLLNDPKITTTMLSTAHMERPIPAPLVPMLTRVVSIFEPDGKHSLGEALVVSPRSDSDFDIMARTVFYLYKAPSVLEWHPIDDLAPYVLDIQTKVKISYPASVRMMAEAVQYDKPDAWVQAHPKDAILEMLKLGHSTKPDEIGPPYVIVHVTQLPGKRPRTHWIQRGVCPSWSKDVGPNELLSLRNRRP